MPRGRSYEDFTPGAVIEHWPGRTVGEGDHRLYCLLTLNAAHQGPEVHAGYLYSLLLGLSTKDISPNATYHTESDIVAISPVLEGDTIYSCTEVFSTTDIPDKTGLDILTMETRVYTHHEALFMSFRRQMAVRRR